jgi:hypothetical protein
MNCTVHKAKSKLITSLLGTLANWELVTDGKTAVKEMQLSTTPKLKNVLNTRSNSTFHFKPISPQTQYFIAECTEVITTENSTKTIVIVHTVSLKLPNLSQTSLSLSFSPTACDAQPAPKTYTD